MFWISTCLLLTVACGAHHVARLRSCLVLWCPEAGNVEPMAQSLLKHPANIFRQNDIRSLAGLASRDGGAHTLVLASNPEVVLVTRSQHVDLHLIVGEPPVAHDLPEVVVAECLQQ